MIFCFENSIFVFAYYSISNLSSSSWIFSLDNGFLFYKIFSAVIISLIVIFSLFRFRSNRIAGAYLFKRILLAFFLAYYPGMFYLLIIPELLFFFSRLFYEEIQLKGNKFVKYIIIEQSIIIIAYPIMQLSSIVPEITLVYVSAVVCLYLAVFIGELILKIAYLQKLSSKYKPSEEKVVEI